MMYERAIVSPSGGIYKRAVVSPSGGGTYSLACSPGQVLHIEGIEVDGVDGEPDPSAGAKCPRIREILKTVQSKCSGKKSCDVIKSDLSLKRKECPGVVSLNLKHSCGWIGGGEAGRGAGAARGRRPPSSLTKLFAGGSDDSTDHVTKLECTPGRSIEIVRMRVFNSNNQPVSQVARSCLALRGVHNRAVSKCVGHSVCYLSRDDLYVHKDQCPGVNSVLFDVKCRPGHYSHAHRNHSYSALSHLLAHHGWGGGDGGADGESRHRVTVTIVRDRDHDQVYALVCSGGGGEGGGGEGSGGIREGGRWGGGGGGEWAHHRPHQALPSRSKMLHHGSSGGGSVEVQGAGAAQRPGLLGLLPGHVGSVETRGRGRLAEVKEKVQNMEREKDEDMFRLLAKDKEQEAEKQRYKEQEKERETERQRKKEAESGRERYREREKEEDRYRDKEAQRERDKAADKDRYRHKEKYTGKEEKDRMKLLSKYRENAAEEKIAMKFRAYIDKTKNLKQTLQLKNAVKQAADQSHSFKQADQSQAVKQDDQLQVQKKIAAVRDRKVAALLASMKEDEMKLSDWLLSSDESASTREQELEQEDEDWEDAGEVRVSRGVGRGKRGEWDGGRCFKVSLDGSSEFVSLLLDSHYLVSSNSLMVIDLAPSGHISSEHPYLPSHHYSTSLQHSHGVNYGGPRHHHSNHSRLPSSRHLHRGHRHGWHVCRYGGVCRNGGFCQTSSIRPRCACPLPYSGRFCEVPATRCLSSPCGNGGTCVVLAGGVQRCVCTARYEGRTCHRARHITCAIHPCRAGGVCEEGVRGFHCSCPPGHFGHLCELRGQACEHNPCEHGGVCLSISAGTRYRCLCDLAHKGRRCQLTSDRCFEQPCLHGGRCFVDSTARYSCNCIHAHDGNRCQRITNACIDDPCINGGSCFDVGNGAYKCVCVRGYVGRNCQKVTASCRHKPCHNKGKCVAMKTSHKYVCKCRRGFSGSHCQFLNGCSSNPCKNGGICVGMHPMRIQKTRISHHKYRKKTIADKTSGKHRPIRDSHAQPIRDDDDQPIRYNHDLLIGGMHGSVNDVSNNPIQAFAGNLSNRSINETGLSVISEEGQEEEEEVDEGEGVGEDMERAKGGVEEVASKQRLKREEKETWEDEKQEEEGEEGEYDDNGDNDDDDDDDDVRSEWEDEENYEGTIVSEGWKNERELSGRRGVGELSPTGGGEVELYRGGRDSEEEGWEDEGGGLPWGWFHRDWHRGSQEGRGHPGISPRGDSGFPTRGMGGRYKRHWNQDGAGVKRRRKTYRCRCLPGYHGDRCERVPKICKKHPCRNGGVCVPVNGARRFTCDCGPLHTGPYCHLDVCASHPCHTFQYCHVNPNRTFSCIDYGGLQLSGTHISIFLCFFILLILFLLFCVVKCGRFLRVVTSSLLDSDPKKETSKKDMKAHNISSSAATRRTSSSSLRSDITPMPLKSFTSAPTILSSHTKHPPTPTTRTPLPPPTNRPSTPTLHPLSPIPTSSSVAFSLPQIITPKTRGQQEGDVVTRIGRSPLTTTRERQELQHQQQQQNTDEIKDDVNDPPKDDRNFFQIILDKMKRRAPPSEDVRQGRGVAGVGITDLPSTEFQDFISRPRADFTLRDPDRKRIIKRRAPPPPPTSPKLKSPLKPQQAQQRRPRAPRQVSLSDPRSAQRGSPSKQSSPLSRPGHNSTDARKRRSPRNTGPSLPRRRHNSGTQKAAQASSDQGQITTPFSFGQPAKQSSPQSCLKPGLQPGTPPRPQASPQPETAPGPQGNPQSETPPANDVKPSWKELANPTRWKDLWSRPMPGSQGGALVVGRVEEGSEEKNREESESHPDPPGLIFVDPDSPSDSGLQFVRRARGVRKQCGMPVEVGATGGVEDVEGASPWEVQAEESPWTRAIRSEHYRLGNSPYDYHRRRVGQRLSESERKRRKKIIKNKNREWKSQSREKKAAGGAGRFRRLFSWFPWNRRLPHCVGGEGGKGVEEEGNMNTSARPGGYRLLRQDDYETTDQDSASSGLQEGEERGEWEGVGKEGGDEKEGEEEEEEDEGDRGSTPTSASHEVMSNPSGTDVLEEGFPGGELHDITDHVTKLLWCSDLPLRSVYGTRTVIGQPGVDMAQGSIFRRSYPIGQSDEEAQVAMYRRRSLVGQSNHDITQRATYTRGQSDRMEEKIDMTNKEEVSRKSCHDTSRLVTSCCKLKSRHENFHAMTSHDMKLQDMKSHDMKSHDMQSNEIMSDKMKSHDIMMSHDIMKSHDTKSHDVKSHALKFPDMNSHAMKLHDMKSHDTTSLCHNAGSKGAKSSCSFVSVISTDSSLH